MARGLLCLANRDVIQRIEAFDARHGGADAAVETDDHWYLFPDGAARQVYIDFATPLNEPSSDPLERARQLRKYAEARLRQARGDFADFKSAISLRAAQAVEHVRANAPPPPPTPADIARLKELQTTVIQRQADFEAAEKALADARPDWQRRRDERAAQVLPALLETQRTIAEIKI